MPTTTITEFVALPEGIAHVSTDRFGLETFRASHLNALNHFEELVLQAGAAGCIVREHNLTITVQAR